MTGWPVLAARSQLMPAHLSVPRRDMAALTVCWSALSTLTTQLPACRIAGKDVEVLATENATIGGSTDRLKNDWQVSPTGRPSAVELMTVMPEANRPRTAVKDAGTAVVAWVASRTVMVIPLRSAPPRATRCAGRGSRRAVRGCAGCAAG